RINDLSYTGKNPHVTETRREGHYSSHPHRSDLRLVDRGRIRTRSGRAASPDHVGRTAGALSKDRPPGHLSTGPIVTGWALTVFGRIEVWFPRFGKRASCRSLQ